MRINLRLNNELQFINAVFCVPILQLTVHLATMACPMVHVSLVLSAHTNQTKEVQSVSNAHINVLKLNLELF